MADPVYLTINEFPGTGAAAPTVVDFNFAGGYISPAHVKAEIFNPATYLRTPVTVTDDNFVTDYRLSLPVVVPTGSVLRVYRDTPKDQPLVDFTNGARIAENNLDLVAQQAVFVAAESADQIEATQVADVLQAVEAAALSAAAAQADASASAASATLSQAAAQEGASIAGGFALNAAASAAASSAAAANAAASSAAAAAEAAAVREDLASTSSGKGAAMVAFKQAGTGAVDRTIDDELKERCSVTQFGADASGLNDSSAAINKGFQKGDVYVPDGVFLLNSPVVVPSSRRLIMSANAVLKAGTNGMDVVKTSGFTSSISLENLNIDGNGKTGVTGLRLSNVQFSSQVTKPNVFNCENGIVLDAVSIGVHIDTPTTYKVRNAIRIVGGSNANKVTVPNLDNTPASGGTNDGIGIYLEGTTNHVDDGFVQGFTHGLRDSGTYNKVKGTYFELMADSAIFWDGALNPCADNVFFFGYMPTPTQNHCVVGLNAKGGSVLFPKMVQGNSTGGLYYFASGNSECYEVHTTDGGTTNTNTGTTTQIDRLIKQKRAASFTPSVEGTAVTGTCTYSKRVGRYVQTGSIVEFSISLTWSGHTGSGNIILAGFPVPAGANFDAESFDVVTSGFAVTGPQLRGYFSSASPFMQVLQVDASGNGTNITLPASGSLSVSGRYFSD